MRGSQNELGVCDTCFGPLYVSMYDPDGKALRRRVERKYLTQLLTGCGQTFCQNEYCKSGRKNRGVANDGKIGSKEATGLIKPILEGLKDVGVPIHLCTDEASQKRRVLADNLAAEGAFADENENEKRKRSADRRGVYELEWCVAALDVESGDLDKSRQWLKDCAPTKNELAR